jgi:hypothetical protein
MATLSGQRRGNASVKAIARAAGQHDYVSIGMVLLASTGSYGCPAAEAGG